MLRQTIFISIAVMCAGSVNAQVLAGSLWTELSGARLEVYEASKGWASPTVRPSTFRVFQLDEQAFWRTVADAPMERLDLEARLRPNPAVISVPMADGTMARFSYVESPVMDPELGARYREIRTWVGQGVDDPTATIRFDHTATGFHAQILSTDGAVYIDPYFDDTAYVVYRKADFVPADKDFQCSVLTVPGAPRVLPVAAVANRTDGQLRTYRLAMACTGEYAAFHGGTVAGALSGIVTTVNRVNGIYETELSVRMTLVADNDSLIFLNALTDPYSNSNGVAMLSQNQSTIDSIIGSSNYDIGHVVSTGGGGVAYLGSVCASFKAGGVTGLSSPVGDAFDVDYVSHEIGHQFGGDHTFNGVTGSCGGGNRVGSSAYEPGSGSTIQAYAGICGSDDIQPHSDPYFHSRSFDQMYTFVVSATCGSLTGTGNAAPIADAGANYTIPRGTPFTLTGSATDADGDLLSYCWEQRDLGPGATLAAPDDGAIPLFRSLNATSSRSRTFPKWSTILANAVDNREKLPQVTRAMDFRLTVRDNRAGAGGVGTDDMVVNVDATKGPFTVSSPNGGETVSSDLVVMWSVAGTTASPVSASAVDILLSVDGGAHFDYILANDTPNDGVHAVTLPEVTTSAARVLVRAEGNIFFDVSNGNFTITAPGTEPRMFTSTDVPIEIGSSSPNTITSTINVPENIQIADINVTLDISHTYDSDLVMSLLSPVGTTVSLISARGSSGDNFTGTTLDDEAAVPISAGTAPFTGDFRPEEPLGAFDAEDAIGTWTLVIQDTFASDGGTLHEWSITIEPAPEDPFLENVYVDFGHSGAELGTEALPYNTVAEGLARVMPGGIVWLKPGSTSETAVIDQDVRLRATGSQSAEIGRVP